jgi:hypothetical protein
MRITRALICCLLALPLATAAGCGDHDDGEAEPFDTLQACYDDHHGDEGLSIQQALVVCCLDHPIAGVHPSCKNTQAECVTHVRGQIGAAVLDADIAAACTTYISQKG